MPSLRENGEPLATSGGRGMNRLRQYECRNRAFLNRTQSDGHLLQAVVCTGFVSALPQYIVPAKKNLSRTLEPSQDARRVFVVSPPPEEATFPSSHL